MTVVPRYKLFLGPDSFNLCPFLSRRRDNGALLYRSRLVFSSRSLFIEKTACINERIKVIQAHYVIQKYRLSLPAAVPPPVWTTRLWGLGKHCNWNNTK